MMAQNMISIDHDYVMAYAKTDQVRLNGLSKDFSNYLNPW